MTKFIRKFISIFCVISLFVVWISAMTWISVCGFPIISVLIFVVGLTLFITCVEMNII